MPSRATSATPSPRLPKHGTSEARLTHGARDQPLRITFVRHGRPTFSNTGWLSRAGFEAWCRAYDAAGLRAGSTPPEAVLRHARAAISIVSSDLRRACESAACLAAAAPALEWPLLREVDLPAVALAPGVRLPLAAWLVAARVGWDGAWLQSTEPRVAAQHRAAAAAVALEDIAQAGPVVAVGHAVFHGLTIAALRRRGWRGPPWLAGRYWATTTLSRAR